MFAIFHNMFAISQIALGENNISNNQKNIKFNEIFIIQYTDIKNIITIINLLINHLGSQSLINDHDIAPA